MNVAWVVGVAGTIAAFVFSLALTGRLRCLRNCWQNSVQELTWHTDHMTCPSWLGLYYQLLDVAEATMVQDLHVGYLVYVCRRWSLMLSLKRFFGHPRFL
ncbi:hypothetical protein BaRGS_00024459 [Batillaria attramentaria]|uniref:Secreted protein n=1 Tax=Batillaria attramentaria TaxID=370345 RepID=A0ABD0KB76_9CAEN